MDCRELRLLKARMVNARKSSPKVRQKVSRSDSGVLVVRTKAKVEESPSRLRYVPDSAVNNVAVDWWREQA